MTQRSKLDRAIEAGSALDWITPLMSELSGDVRLGVMQDDHAATDATLQAISISQWRRTVGYDYYNFNVSREYADMALDALAAAGIKAWRL